tara:strand:- start:1425 stop:1643 length:219 start_codon:yes stop_codon:yes gene_type:complete
MAITNFKKDEPQDNFDRLMCSVPGCPKRWSVDMGKPMCSEHQWSDRKPATRRDIAVVLTHPPVQHWQDDEVF